MFGILIFLFLLFCICFYIVYLREYVEVTRTYKSLRKLLESRDLLILKILPDVKNKKITKKILNLINERRIKSKVSYDDGIIADVALNSELKELYDEIDKMKKNEIQIEVFKHIVLLEKQLKLTRKRYSEAVTKYNLELTVHPKVLIKIMHMRPLELYK